MHKVLFICTFLVLMVSNSISMEVKTNSSTTTPGQDEKLKLYCPLYGIDFRYHDLPDVAQSTRSWQECGNRCKLFDECKFWSWSSSWRVCWLKTSKQGISTVDHAISGDRGCPL